MHLVNVSVFMQCYCQRGEFRIERGLNAKSMGYLNSILFDLAVPEIFYFKHDVGALML